jgi:hypothetical protein
VLRSSGDVWGPYTLKPFITQAQPQAPLSGQINQGALVDTPAGGVRQQSRDLVETISYEWFIVVLDGLFLVLPERPVRSSSLRPCVRD